MMAITLIWNVRIVDFLAELKFFSLITTSLSRLTKPFFGRLLFLYLLYHMYVQIGQIAYGGYIYKQSVLEADPGTVEYYWLLNFNDFCSGLVTLFQIMVVNNWWVTTDMYCSVMQSRWPIVFFASFWIFSVLILLNIVTASVIDVYSTSEEVLTAKYNFIDNSRYLQKRFKGMSDDEISKQVEIAMKLLDEVEGEENEEEFMQT